MADDVQERISAIERELYAPENYDAMQSQPVDRQRVVTALAEELNRLRKRQIEEAAERFGPVAPPGGARLSVGSLPRPRPPEPEDWQSEAGDYSPLRRFVEADLRGRWED